MQGSFLYISRGLCACLEEEKTQDLPKKIGRIGFDELFARPRENTNTGYCTCSSRILTLVSQSKLKPFTTAEPLHKLNWLQASGYNERIAALPMV